MPPRVTVTHDTLEMVRAHGERDYPLEACGLLVGTAAGSTFAIERAVPVKNLNRERAHDRYDLDQAGFVAADRRARSEGLDIVGIYHSHPDHPAQPSEFDRTHAYPGWAYMIVEVAQGRSRALGVFVLEEESGAFEEAEIES